MNSDYHEGRAQGWEEGYERGRRAGMKEAAAICYRNASMFGGSPVADEIEAALRCAGDAITAAIDADKEETE